MMLAKILPMAEVELRSLDEADHRRILGAVREVRLGHRTGESCLTGTVPIWRLCVWQYVIVYVILREVLWVVEVCDSSSVRDSENRIIELEGHLRALNPDDFRVPMLESTLKMLQPSA